MLHGVRRCFIQIWNFWETDRPFPKIKQGECGIKKSKGPKNQDRAPAGRLFIQKKEIPMPIERPGSGGHFGRVPTAAEFSVGKSRFSTKKNSFTTWRHTKKYFEENLQRSIVALTLLHPIGSFKGCSPRRTQKCLRHDPNLKLGLITVIYSFMPFGPDVREGFLLFVFFVAKQFYSHENSIFNPACPDAIMAIIPGALLCKPIPPNFLRKPVFLREIQLGHLYGFRHCPRSRQRKIHLFCRFGCLP